MKLLSFEWNVARNRIASSLFYELNKKLYKVAASDSLIWKSIEQSTKQFHLSLNTPKDI